MEEEFDGVSPRPTKPMKSQREAVGRFKNENALNSPQSITAMTSIAVCPCPVVRTEQTDG